MSAEGWEFLELSTVISNTPARIKFDCGMDINRRSSLNPSIIAFCRKMNLQTSSGLLLTWLLLTWLQTSLLIHVESPRTGEGVCYTGAFRMYKPITLSFRDASQKECEDACRGHFDLLIEIIMPGFFSAASRYAMRWADPCSATNYLCLGRTMEKSTVQLDSSQLAASARCSHSCYRSFCLCEKLLVLQHIQIGRARLRGAKNWEMCTVADVCKRLAGRWPESGFQCSTRGSGIVKDGVGCSPTMARLYGRKKHWCPCNEHGNFEIPEELCFSIDIDSPEYLQATHERWSHQYVEEDTPEESRETAAVMRDEADFRAMQQSTAALGAHLGSDTIESLEDLSNPRSDQVYKIDLETYGINLGDVSSQPAAANPFPGRTVPLNEAQEGSSINTIYQQKGKAKTLEDDRTTSATSISLKRPHQELSSRRVRGRTAQGTFRQSLQMNDVAKQQKLALDEGKPQQIVNLAAAAAATNTRASDSGTAGCKNPVDCASKIFDTSSDDDEQKLSSFRFPP